MTYVTELVPNTQIVKLACPVKRLMNTQDYDDAKVEIGLEYDIKPFYLIVGPETVNEDTGETEQNLIYGNGPLTKILILDSSYLGLMKFAGLLALISTILFV